MKIDAHHHLWKLDAVSYPWLEARGQRRFFGDPAAIQRDYLLPEFRLDAHAAEVQASVHIQVGAADAYAEAKWVQGVATAYPDWPLRQVVFCDLTAPDVQQQLDRLQSISSVVGVRQIVGRAPGEDVTTGTQGLLANPTFVRGLQAVADRGLCFDLQLLPELMGRAGEVFRQVPELKVALCHAGSPHNRSAAGVASYEFALKSLSSLPNIVCKISGLGMFDHGWTSDSVRPFFEACLQQFGAERLMFGSNFPVDSLSSTYATLVARHLNLTRDLSPDQKAHFWGLTAKGFYGF